MTRGPYRFMATCEPKKFKAYDQIAMLAHRGMKVSRNMPLLWSLELVWGPEAINMALLRSLKFPLRESPGRNDTRALPVHGHIANRRSLRPMIKSQRRRIVA